MKKRIEVKLLCMVNWLESNVCNYTQEDFKKDVKRLQEAIHEAEYNDIITIKQANELNELVLKYALKHF